MEPKKIKKFQELPFEVGKVYKTKFATGDTFLLTKDPYKRAEDGTIIKASHTVFGIYVGKEHIGECPLSIERLIPDKEFTGEYEVCECCGREL